MEGAVEEEWQTFVILITKTEELLREKREAVAFLNPSLILWL